MPILLQECAMTQTRKRVKHLTSFEERLAEEARRFREAAEQQPPGSTARELLMRRARQAEAASHMNNWLSSPGLAAPK
jgi:hypothetical protein